MSLGFWSRSFLVCVRDDEIIGILEFLLDIANAAACIRFHGDITGQYSTLVML